MVDPIRVNSHGLRAAQPMVAQSAGAIRATLGQLVRALDAEGACWGADATGQTFAASYVPAMQTTRQAFADLHAAVDSIAGSLLIAADNADATDSRAGRRLG
jgi:uncharacterized protein YukE